MMNFKMREISKGLLLGTAISLAGLATADTVYTLDYEAGSITGGPYATVTLAQVAAGVVDVTISPEPGYGLIDTGAGSPLMFNLLGSPTLTAANISNLTAGFGYTFFAPGLSSNQDGTGQWMYMIDCGTACGSGGSDPYFGDLSFRLTLVGLTEASFISTANSNNFVFAADICVGDGSGGCSATGDAATSSSSSSSQFQFQFQFQFQLQQQQFQLQQFQLQQFQQQQFQLQQQR